MKCDDCGQEKEDVTYTPDPYAEEIHGEENWMYLCGDCYQQRLWDI